MLLMLRYKWSDRTMCACFPILYILIKTTAAGSRCIHLQTSTKCPLTIRRSQRRKSHSKAYIQTHRLLRKPAVIITTALKNATPYRTKLVEEATHRIPKRSTHAQKVTCASKQKRYQVPLFRNNIQQINPITNKQSKCICGIAENFVYRLLLSKANQTR